MDRSNWKNFLVEVRAATGEGDATVATGFAVAPDLILTARHAVQANGRLLSPAWVRWPYLGRTGWSPAKEIAWPIGGDTSADDLDAALLRCEMPDDAHRFGYILNETPNQGREWSSSGFADAGAYSDDNRVAYPMSGTIEATADVEDIFLHTKIAVEKDRDWQGASGSPVFVKGTWDIIGVVRTCAPGSRSELLAATPSYKLLRNEAFRTLVRAGESAQRLRRFADLEKQAAAMLRSMKAARETVRSLCPVERRPGETEEASLARALRALDCESVIETLRSAHQSLLVENDRAGVKVIKELACLIIPATFEAVNVDAIGPGRGSAGDAVVSLRVSNHTVAEFAMARADGRCAAFRPLLNGQRWPWGRDHLPPGPEIGLFDAPERFCEIWRAATLKEFLSEGEISGLKSEGVDPFHTAANRMQLEARQANKTKYFVIDIPGKKFEGSEWPSVIAALKKDYPAVVFLRFDRSQVVDRDDNLFWTFLSVLVTGVEDLP